MTLNEVKQSRSTCVCFSSHQFPRPWAPQAGVPANTRGPRRQVFVAGVRTGLRSWGRDRDLQTWEQACFLIDPPKSVRLVSARTTGCVSPLFPTPCSLSPTELRPPLPPNICVFAQQNCRVFERYLNRPKNGTSFTKDRSLCEVNR